MEKTYPMEVTKNEARLIAILRSLKPFEEVVLSADKNGQPDSYVVKRSYREQWIIEVARP